MQTQIPDGPALLVSVSEAARMKGVTKQTISEKLARLVDAELIAVAKRGREKVFSLAAYDAAVNEVTDPARVIAQQTAKTVRTDDDEDFTAAPKASARPSAYNDALTRKAQLDADARQIDIDRQMGRLLPVDEVTIAMERCAEAVTRDLDQMVSFADDFAAAMTRGGVSALREEIRKKVRGLRATLAQSMTLLGGESDDQADEAA